MNETIELVSRSRRLTTALRTYSPTALPLLRELTEEVTGGEAPNGPDDEGSDWATDLERDTVLLENLATRAEQDNQNRSNDGEKGVQATISRNNAAESLRGELRSAIADVQKNHGRQYRRVFGLEDAPTRNIDELVVQAETVRERLLDDTIPSPPLRPGGKVLKRQTIAAALEEKITDVREAVLAMDGAKIIAASSVIQRRKSNRLLRRVYNYVGRRSEGSFRMVGLDELADNLRDVRRARPTPEEDPDGTDPDGTDPDGTDPDGTGGTDPDPVGTDPDPGGSDPGGTDPAPLTAVLSTT